MNSNFNRTVVAVAADSLQSLLEERQALLANLTATQKRCTELVLENRSLDASNHHLQDELRKAQHRLRELEDKAMEDDVSPVGLPEQYSFIVHPDILSRDDHK